MQTNPQVHDLLQINHASLGSRNMAEPSWVRKTMLDCPWVVVLRGQSTFGHIAVGVRGDRRSDRWAASCGKSLVRDIVRPEELLLRDGNAQRTPALRALWEMR